jgi:prepilin-type N-terminal cleavage/methylation domain-containing protein
MKDCRLFLGWRIIFRSGLTLIELLLVIGILAVLAGICWMAYASAKEKTLLFICRNNFRQIYLAVQKYRDDYDGIDPDGRPLGWAEVGLPSDDLIIGLIRGGYIKKGSPILHCPIGERILKEGSAEIERHMGRRLGIVIISSYGYPANLPIHNPLKQIAEHFSRCVAQKRSQVAILGDRWHNPPRPPEAPPIPTPLFPQWELVLRLDGQVDWVLVTDGKACR